jgi:hypothetical protein
MDMALLHRHRNGLSVDRMAISMRVRRGTCRRSKWVMNRSLAVGLGRLKDREVL